MKKKNFNKYEIVNDYAIIYLEKRNGQIIKCYVDLEDLNRLEKLNWRWCAVWDSDIKNYYIKHSEYLGAVNGKFKYKITLLHRWIMNTNKNEYVDHKNHNTIDNRKNNLRVTRNDKNTKNRKSKNSNNTSGYRNVSWVNNKWIVQLQIKGKNKVLGKFDDINKAGKFAEKMRKKYYGDFAGNN